jgi:hypothetical protein
MKATLRRLFNKMIEKKIIWCVDSDPDQEPPKWALYMSKQRRGGGSRALQHQAE